MEYYTIIILPFLFCGNVFCSRGNIVCSWRSQCNDRYLQHNIWSKYTVVPSRQHKIVVGAIWKAQDFACQLGSTPVSLKRLLQRITYPLRTSRTEKYTYFKWFASSMVFVPRRNKKLMYSLLELMYRWSNWHFNLPMEIVPASYYFKTLFNFWYISRRFITN